MTRFLLTCWRSLTELYKSLMLMVRVRLKKPLGRSLIRSKHLQPRIIPTVNPFYAAKSLKFNRFGLLKGLLWASVGAILFSSIGSGWFSPTSIQTAKAATVINLPLSTRGEKIIDASGKPVLLRGVNWFGLETNVHAPHGLWKRDYKEMLAQIKSLGYNVIRLPYSLESLRSSNVSGIDFSIGSNRELEGKTPLEVLDYIIAEAQRQELLILLDSHQLNVKQRSELWYGDGFTEADWIDTWKMLATRYKNQPNVIGADLKNEPHGRASWGTNDISTDWRLAAERAGNAILAINPNWLILVEGVEKNVPGQKLLIHWQGGNLEGVRRNPVRLSIPNKVVYSPHEYGPGVYNLPWFSEPSFPNNLYSRWEIGFNYIATAKIAPIWIGEFGGRQVDPISKEGIWQRQLVNYINRNNLSFTYWSWNPNSGDTGGILQDDWLTVDAPKQELLNQLLSRASYSPNVSSNPINRDRNLPPSVRTPKNPLPSTSARGDRNLPPSVRRTPPKNPLPSASIIQPNQSPLKLTVMMQSDWATGFCVSMQVVNQGNTRVRDWQVKFQMNQATINNSWNGNFKSNGNNYVVIPLDWGRVIEPNNIRDIGFCANKIGADYRPTRVSVSSQ